MSRMCCVGCDGLSLTQGGRDHFVTDAKGRRWTFEQHPWCGPIVLRKDGQPKSRQPGSRSIFWPAYQAWSIANQAG
jgi:hypothetical protein